VNNFDSEKLLSVPREFLVKSESEHLHEYRTDFQRDRDRILYSKSFRRLSGKTQVFLPLSHDHVRNRLTHSLEVSQISRVSARYLNLNETMVEAMSLGHDLGHTPFGHVGERSLNLIMNNCGNFSEAQGHLNEQDKGFKHNLQSVRVCCDLNKIYPNISGMNLTNFTLWGIQNHSSLSLKNCGYFEDDTCYLKLKRNTKCNTNGQQSVGFYDKYISSLTLPDSEAEPWSFEAYLVAYADEIAQRHHDVEDSIHMSILDRDTIIEKISECFSDLLVGENRTNFENVKSSSNKQYFLPLISRFLVHMYNQNLIDTSLGKMEKFLKDNSINLKNDFAQIYPSLRKKDYQNIIGFSEEMKTADKKFNKFIKNAILNSFFAQRMDGKGLFVIRQLFKAYLTNPKQLHDATIVAVYNLYNDQNESISDISKSKIGQYREEIGKPSNKNNPRFQVALLRSICDHISGMTDNFVLSEYERLYGGSMQITP
jgi:dGTPase